MAGVLFVSLSSDLISVGYLLTGLLLFLLVRQPLYELDKPGSKGFLLAVIAISLWPLSVGVNTFVDALGLSIAIWNVRLLAAALVSVGWFLLAYEFTTQRIPSRPVLLALAGYTGLSQILAWTNQTHFLVLGPETVVRNGVLLPDFGIWFWMQAAINYTLILGATGLLATEWLRSRSLRRRQAAFLALAVVPPIAANLVTIFGIVETIHDLTPFGLIGSGLILSWTLYRQEFLNVVPVGRDTAIEVMDDAVIIVDESNRVVDCNTAAKRLFGHDEDYYGLSLQDFLEPLSEPMFDRLTEKQDSVDLATDVQGELSFEVRDRQRHFSYTRSAVSGTSETRIGQILVLRDITTLKHREEDLELLQQVLTRILRHNLRNKLNVIESYADLLDDEYDDDRITEIIDASRSLNALGEKAGYLEQIIQPDVSDEEYDLYEIVYNIVDTFRDRYPAANITTDIPDSCVVRTTVGLPIAIECLLENAIEHNDTSNPRVFVTVVDRSDGIRLTIEDNGSGIPEYELAVLETRKETALNHGSGIGLWIVRWWADRSDVLLSFESDADGTVVSMEFPETDSPEEHP